MKRKGFTLIELIVVIAILATLAALAMPTFKGLIDTAKKRTDVANAKAMYNTTIATLVQESSGTSTHFNSNAHAYQTNTNISFYQHNTMSANVVDGDGNSYKLIFALRMTKSGKTVGFHCNSEANTFKDAFRANFQNGVTPAFANKELGHGTFNTFVIGYRADNKDAIEIWAGVDLAPYCKIYPREGADKAYR